MVVLSVLAFFVFAFLLVAITVVAAWMTTRRSSEQAGDEALRDQEAEQLTILRRERLSDMALWDSLLQKFDFAAIIRSHMEQAEVTWSVGRLTALILLAGTVTGVILVKLAFVPAWAAAGGSLGAAWLPYGYVRRMRARRFRKFQDQFPDVLDSLSRALRAGYPIAAALEMVATETASPAGTEMRKTVTEANLGSGWKLALENLARRMPIPEVNMFAAAVQLHARTGGRLSEVMGNVAETMREAAALRGEVRSIAAHGKLTGLILTIVPVMIGVMMMMVAPQYMAALLEHPYGKHLIWAAVACLVLAHIVIRKLVDLKV